MVLGSEKHKAEFLDGIRKEYHENIWKNELHILRLRTELEMVQEELDKLNATLKAKGKPAANEEKKQEFVLVRSIEGKQKEIAAVEDMKLKNQFGLEVLIPKYLGKE